MIQEGYAIVLTGSHGRWSILHSVSYITDELLSIINIYSGYDTNHVYSSNTLHLSEEKIRLYFTVRAVKVTQ